MGSILAVSISKLKGTKKANMAKGVLKENYGLTDDAHADSNNHRQISLLAIESINKMRNLGYDVNPGGFAENLTTKGIDLVVLPIGAKIYIGEEVVLEITQIGKECHTGCTIFRQVGKCIMPKEGIFARVACGGLVTTGDPVRVVK